MEYEFQKRIASGREDEAEHLNNNEAANPPSASAFDPEQPEAVTQGFHTTDIGNALRLIAGHGHQVHYVPPWKTWLVWDGARWRPDDTGEVRRLAHRTSQNIYAEASLAGDPDKRKKIASWAIKSEDTRRITNMLHEARVMEGIPILPDELDVDPMLLCVENGTLNLRTGLLQPHRQTDLLTKKTPVVYDKTVGCPNWLAFLDTVTGGDDDLALFLQFLVGYWMTGSTDEACFAFLFGTGRNGKSTFVTAVETILLPEHTTRTSAEAILSQYRSRGGTATPYIADLAGKRLAIAPEIPSGRALDESVVKDLTGQEMLTARYLHGNPFTFPPTHKLCIVGNHQPKLVNTDLGIQSRVRIVPFRVTIPKDAERPMSELLAEFRAEASGILNWALEGCLLWQTNGLPDAEAVREATREYISENDLLQQFIEERCEMHPDYSVAKPDFYSRFLAWGKSEDSDFDIAKRWLSDNLKAKGIDVADRKTYRGIRFAGGF